MKLAPIILFVYRRIPTGIVDSLLSNKLSISSDIFIFSDGYKCDDDKDEVLEVREYLKNIVGFKSVIIKESLINKGLSCSIIDGVTDIIEKYEKVIVLEDDLIVSSDFIEFMNKALTFYENENHIWSISGYSAQLPILKSYEYDLYLSVRGSSWGWATWINQWKSVDWSVKDFIKIKSNKNMKNEFELGGNDLFRMLNLQMSGKIDSWAIRWCFSQFIQNKYTVYPSKSKVINNGFSDLRSVHNNGQKWLKFQTTLSDGSVRFVKNIELNKNIIEEFYKLYSLNIYSKLGYFVKQYGGYTTLKKIIKIIR